MSWTLCGEFAIWASDLFPAGKQTNRHTRTHFTMEQFQLSSNLAVFWSCARLRCERNRVAIVQFACHRLDECVVTRQNAKTPVFRSEVKKGKRTLVNLLRVP